MKGGVTGFGWGEGKLLIILYVRTQPSIDKKNQYYLCCLYYYFQKLCCLSLNWGGKNSNKSMEKNLKIFAGIWSGFLIWLTQWHLSCSLICILIIFLCFPLGRVFLVCRLVGLEFQLINGWSIFWNLSISFFLPNENLQFGSPITQIKVAWPEKCCGFWLA